MQTRGLLNYRLKFCWLKVICCVIYHSNELERKIKHKTGWSSRMPAKSLGGHGPHRTPLRTTTA